jgi:hypothetical protein
MYEITNAHPVTLIVIIGAFLVTPIYAMATYVFSGASKKKGLRVGAGDSLPPQRLVPRFNSSSQKSPTTSSSSPRA